MEVAMTTMSLNANDRLVSVVVDDPDTPLLCVLKNELGLHGPRFGCGLCQCRVCCRKRLSRSRPHAAFQSSIYIGIAAILAAFIVVFATAPKARAQDNGHHLHHVDHYSKWKQPGTNASCCNGKETKDGQSTGDCYPTTAEVR